MSDLVKRLETLKKSIDETKSLKIELSARAKKEEELFLEKIKEIKDLGFDPKTLKDDLIKMQSELETKMTEKEKEVIEARSKLEAIEKNSKL